MLVKIYGWILKNLNKAILTVLFPCTELNFKGKKGFNKTRETEPVREESGE